jgi:DNA-binding transcriptional ArsR family regulator
MDGLPNIARVGALIGDPVRVAMLGALMDGCEHPAGELAGISGIAPQTASGHLRKLLDGGLLAATRRGRHRYFRLKDSEVAHAIEILSVAASLGAAPPSRVPPDLRLARRCYDHVAGKLGVVICRALIASEHVVAGGPGYTLSASGRQWASDVGLANAGTSRRPLVRSCLDWTERQPHLAGWLGHAIYQRLEAEHAIRVSTTSRALRLEPRAPALLRQMFGVHWPTCVAAPA